jgi:hypothetical protein
MQILLKLLDQLLQKGQIFLVIDSQGTQDTDHTIISIDMDASIQTRNNNRMFVISALIDEAIIYLTSFDHLRIQKFEDFLRFNKRYDLSGRLQIFGLCFVEQIINPEIIVFIILEKSDHDTIDMTTQSLDHISQPIP